jgi:hypothetical protein
MHSDTRPGHFTFCGVQWRNYKNGTHLFLGTNPLGTPEQTNKQTNCTLLSKYQNKPINKQIVHFCPNINLTALKDIRQNPTLSHFHTLLPCSIIRNISLHSLHQSQGPGKVPPKLDERRMSTATHFL